MAHSVNTTSKTWHHNRIAKIAVPNWTQKLPVYCDSLNSQLVSSRRQKRNYNSLPTLLRIFRVISNQNRLRLYEVGRSFTCDYIVQYRFSGFNVSGAAHREVGRLQSFSDPSAFAWSAVDPLTDSFYFTGAQTVRKYELRVFGRTGRGRWENRKKYTPAQVRSVNYRFDIRRWPHGDVLTGGPVGFNPLIDRVDGLILLLFID